MTETIARAERTETRSLTYRDGRSDKFWSITLAGATHTVSFGRSGTAGQTQRRPSPPRQAARASMEKLVAEKLRKGYVESAGAPGGAAARRRPRRRCLPRRRLPRARRLSGARPRRFPGPGSRPRRLPLPRWTSPAPSPSIPRTPCGSPGGSGRRSPARRRAPSTAGRSRTSCVASSASGSRAGPGGGTGPAPGSSPGSRPKGPASGWRRCCARSPSWAVRTRTGPCRTRTRWYGLWKRTGARSLSTWMPCRPSSQRTGRWRRKGSFPWPRCSRRKAWWSC